ncbi:MAG: hypothetical protein HUU57_17140 [Bdellovibrio sp.]|nr:hypothetical protein [Bdellovibrio sp.]
MLIKTRRSIWTTLGFLLVLISFQNCTPQSFSALEQASTKAGTDENLVSQDGTGGTSGGAAAPSANSDAGKNNTSGASSAQSATATNSSGTNSSSTEPSAPSCSTYASMLNWDSNEQFRVEIGGVMTRELDGTKAEIPAYSSFNIAFSNNRAGTHAFNAIGFMVASSGFSIKIEDPEAGSIEVPISAYEDPQNIVTKRQAVIASWDSGGLQVGSRAGFLIKKDFYFSNLTKFKNSKVSLYCNNKLVASGTQDIRVLDFELNTVFVRTKSGGYTFRDSERSAFVNISCPLEVRSGSNIQCTASGVGMISGYWIVDGKEERSFDNQTTYIMNKALTGNHTFQAVVKYSGGLEDRSEIFMVKAR